MRTLTIKKAPYIGTSITNTAKMDVHLKSIQFASYKGEKVILTHNQHHVRGGHGEGSWMTHTVKVYNKDTLKEIFLEDEDQIQLF